MPLQIIGSSMRYAPARREGDIVDSVDFLSRDASSCPYPADAYNVSKVWDDKYDCKSGSEDFGTTYDVLSMRIDPSFQIARLNPRRRRPPPNMRHHSPSPSPSPFSRLQSTTHNHIRRISDIKATAARAASVPPRASSAAACLSSSKPMHSLIDLDAAVLVPTIKSKSGPEQSLSLITRPHSTPLDGQRGRRRLPHHKKRRTQDWTFEAAGLMDSESSDENHMSISPPSLIDMEVSMPITLGEPLRPLSASPAFSSTHHCRTPSSTEISRLGQGPYTHSPPFQETTQSLAPTVSPSKKVPRRLASPIRFQDRSKVTDAEGPPEFAHLVQLLTNEVSAAIWDNLPEFPPLLDPPCEGVVQGEGSREDIKSELCRMFSSLKEHLTWANEVLDVTYTSSF